MSMDELDLSRREFAQVGVASLLTLPTNVQPVQSDPNISTEGEYQSVVVLAGPKSARPAPNSDFFSRDDVTRKYYAYRYDALDTGEEAVITQDRNSWQPLNYIQRRNIFSASDLPEPTNGTHTLDARTAYIFNGFVTSQNGLDISNGPALLGRHGSMDGFIHTGQQTAITGTNGGFFARDLYLHAPLGQMFDLTATTSEEMLVESISMSDAAGLGNIANLGTIDGFRVPTFKGCNFEDFDAGLTFTGTPEKVHIIDSPLRGVTASGVTILEFDANLSTNIVDLPKNYVKDVQSDTEVIRVDPNATVSEIFQYTGNTHDASVTKSNILTGAAGTDVVGYRVKNSFPITDSVAIGNYSLDSNSTATISTQATDKNDGDAYVTIPGATTSELNIRWTIGDNEATYNGKKDTQTQLTATLSLGTGGGDTVATAWFRNGSIVSGTPTRTATQGTGNAVGQSTSSVGICPDCTTDDTYDIRVANLDSTGDIDVGEMNGLLEADV